MLTGLPGLITTSEWHGLTFRGAGGPNKFTVAFFFSNFHMHVSFSYTSRAHKYKSIFKILKKSQIVF
jgi:hypothetical protein